jgi:hypothetical protein
MSGCPLTFRWRPGPALSLGIWECPIPRDQSSNDTAAANRNRASGQRIMMPSRAPRSGKRLAYCAAPDRKVTHTSMHDIINDPESETST